MNISVIIPAYNEEKRIIPTLNNIINYLDNNFDRYEIIIVDDSSTDSTNKIISEYESDNIKILKNRSNKGKGYSVKTGIQEAVYPLVLFSDSDLSTPIEEVEKFIGFINEGNDIVIASRGLPDSTIKVSQPISRKILGLIFPLLVNLIALKGFKDTQCGFKLFKTDAAKKIVSMQTFDRFSFDVELLYIAKKLDYKIKEAPVVWIDKEGTTVNFMKDGFKMFLDLFKIRFNDLTGKYND